MCNLFIQFAHENNNGSKVRKVDSNSTGSGLSVQQRPNGSAMGVPMRLWEENKKGRAICNARWNAIMRMLATRNRNPKRKKQSFAWRGKENKRVSLLVEYAAALLLPIGNGIRKLRRARNPRLSALAIQL